MKFFLAVEVLVALLEEGPIRRVAVFNLSEAHEVFVLLIGALGHRKLPLLLLVAALLVRVVVYVEFRIRGRLGVPIRLGAQMHLPVHIVG